jgi:hypothetical protein
MILSFFVPMSGSPVHVSRKQASVAIPTLEGQVDMTFEIKREGKIVSVERHGTSRPRQLLLVGIKSIVSVDGGGAESAQGAYLRYRHSKRIG